MYNNGQIMIVGGGAANGDCGNINLNATVPAWTLHQFDVVCPAPRECDVASRRNRPGDRGNERRRVRRLYESRISRRIVESSHRDLVDYG